VEGEGERERVEWWEGWEEKIRVGFFLLGTIFAVSLHKVRLRKSIFAGAA
jgi:hypothetical protein